MIKIEKVVIFDFSHIKNLYLFESKKVTKKIRTYKKIKIPTLWDTLSIRDIDKDIIDTTI
jgi:RNAse (barnase) inhibitor barstar